MMKANLRTIIAAAALFLSACIQLQAQEISRAMATMPDTLKAKADTSTVARLDTVTVPQPKVYTNEYLDTVQIQKSFKLNNYSLLGFETGYYYNNVAFNPSMRTGTFINYGHYSLMFTHYQKMFGFMPYFGYRLGLSYGKQGFRFKEDKEKHTINYIYGDTVQETFDIVEVPFLLHAHVDAPFFKIFADAGIFGAYRLNIERQGYGENVPSDQYNFKSFENRFDYGLEGGIGVGFVLKPFEIHVSGKLRYSWGSLYQPDYLSPYYYRFANPWDGIITVGIHYQLTKRSGKTKKEIKQEAYDYVYAKPEYPETPNTARQGR